jgi:hypothetical protein
MKLSDSLQAILSEYETQPLSIDTLLKLTGEHGFGILLGVFVLPMLVPLPVPIPGFSTLFGSGIILLGLQLTCNRSQPYLPPRLARLELAPNLSRVLLKNLKRLLWPLERLAQPRLSKLSDRTLARRVIGLCLAWNAFLMALPLPIPLSNLIPAYSILALTIGILESDGIFVLIGYGMTGVTTAFFISIAGAIWLLLINFLQAVYPR